MKPGEAETLANQLRDALDRDDEEAAAGFGFALLSGAAINLASIAENLAAMEKRS